MDPYCVNRFGRQSRRPATPPDTPDGLGLLIPDRRTNNNHRLRRTSSSARAHSARHNSATSGPRVRFKFWAKARKNRTRISRIARIFSFSIREIRAIRVQKSAGVSRQPSGSAYKLKRTSAPGAPRRSLAAPRFSTLEPIRKIDLRVNRPQGARLRRLLTFGPPHSRTCHTCTTGFAPSAYSSSTYSLCASRS